MKVLIGEMCFNNTRGFNTRSKNVILSWHITRLRYPEQKLGNTVN